MKFERIFIGFLLFLIGILTAVDVFEDFKEGSKMNHLGLDIAIAVIAIMASGYLLKKYLKEKNKSKTLESEKVILKDIGEKFEKRSKIFIDGLAVQIDREFDIWQLTPSEREIGLFLLKGLSTSEIADIRGSSEKTVRHQIASIYKKAGLKSRQEFQAYFLEDLLPPSDITSS